jgi:hypothetical protein
MSQVLFYAPSSNSSLQSTINFSPFDGEDDLPFPLNLSFPARFIISFCLGLALLVGTKLRFIIFAYMRAPGSNASFLILILPNNN